MKSIRSYLFTFLNELFTGFIRIFIMSLVGFLKIIGEIVNSKRNLLLLIKMMCNKCVIISL